MQTRSERINYISPESEQFWFHPDFEPSRRQFEDEPGKIIIGLDTSHLPVRAIVTVVGKREGRTGLCPYGCASFEKLEAFRRYWARYWNYSGIQVATPIELADPLGVRAWLESEGFALETYRWSAYRTHLANDMTLQNLSIEPEFERPYALAIYALYRRAAPEVAARLWEKLLETNCILNDLRHEAHRLAVGLANETREGDEIPY